MRKRTDTWARLAVLLAPFAVLFLLIVAGASDETLSAGFLTAAFLCYLLVPAYYFERRRLDRG
jgi:predicted PurR-regulated permease PerM